MRQVVILAAGKGVRLKPFTDTKPKPLVDINDRPFIHYIFKNLESAGFERVFLVVEYLKEQIIEYVDNHNFSFDVVIVEQGEPLGTGHAVKVVEGLVQGNFVVINGDDLFSVKDLSKINLDDNYSYIFGGEHPNPQNFGVLEIEGDFLIGIQEKPKNPATNIINLGLYKFTSEIFEAIDKIEKSPRGEYELTDAIMFLVQKRKMKVLKVEGYCFTLGCPDDIPILENFLKENS